MPNNPSQPEFNLSNPDHPDFIEGFGPEVFDRLATLESQGARWTNLKAGKPGSPGWWKITLWWPRDH